jgi:hypothetical protein
MAPDIAFLSHVLLSLGGAMHQVDQEYKRSCSRKGARSMGVEFENGIAGGEKHRFCGRDRTTISGPA